MRRGVTLLGALCLVAGGRSARADDAALVGEIQARFPAARRWFGMVADLQLERDAGGGLVPRFDSLRSPRVLRGDPAGESLAVRLPGHLGEPVRVGLAGRPGLWIDALEEGAADRPASVTAGLVVYRGAVAGGDLLYKLTPTHADQYLYLRAPPPELDERIDLVTGPEVGELRGSGTAVFVFDRQGVARLRANAPFARAADGTRRQGTIRVEGRTLLLSLDLRGLAAPVLVDPDWSTTGTMSIGRFLASTFLLPGGSRVLVAGGCTATVCPQGLASPGCTSALATTETWDQAGGTWMLTATMATGRFAYAGASLPGGDVLVAGGCTAVMCSAVTGAAERYSASADAWAPAGALSSPRAHIAAATLATGDVLAIGGCDSSACYASVDRYSPATGTWSAAAPLAGPRGHATADLLPDGRVLVIGGCADTACGVVLGDAEIYDPVANAWSPAGSMATPRAAHSATVLGDGRVLVAGGCADAACKSPLSSTELWRADATRGGLFDPGPSMASARHGHSATRLITGEVLIAGGAYDAMATTPGAEVFVPSGPRWISIGAMGMGREDHAATLLADGDVLVTGGCNPSTCMPWCELYSPAGLPAEEGGDGGSREAGPIDAAPVADGATVGAADLTPHPAAYRSGTKRCATDLAQDLTCPQPGYALEDGDLQPDRRTYTPVSGGLADASTGLTWETPGEATAYARDGAVQHCAALGGGWRAPSVVELTTLVDYGAVSPAIDGAFGATPAVDTWTSTSVPGSPTLGWVVSFDEGMVMTDVATATHPVRCVRGALGGTDADVGRLRQSGPLAAGVDTVTAPADGLEWQLRDDGVRRSWRDALAYCAGLRLGGESGWHLPNVLELHGLVDYSHQGAGAAIDPLFADARADDYWSSTPQQGSPGYAWIVSFNSGVVDGVTGAGGAYVRCVRHLTPAPGGGCGCDLGRGPGPAGPGVILLLALVGAAARRRRRQ